MVVVLDIKLIKNFLFIYKKENSKHFSEWLTNKSYYEPNI